METLCYTAYYSSIHTETTVGGLPLRVLIFSHCNRLSTQTYFAWSGLLQTLHKKNTELASITPHYQ